MCRKYFEWFLWEMAETSCTNKWIPLRFEKLMHLQLSATTAHTPNLTQSFYTNCKHISLTTEREWTCVWACTWAGMCRSVYTCTLACIVYQCECDMCTCIYVMLYTYTHKHITHIYLGVGWKSRCKIKRLQNGWFISGHFCIYSLKWNNYWDFPVSFA